MNYRKHDIIYFGNLPATHLRRIDFGDVYGRRELVVGAGKAMSRFGEDLGLLRIADSNLTPTGSAQHRARSAEDGARRLRRCRRRGGGIL